jgi:hypothetical protein
MLGFAGKSRHSDEARGCRRLRSKRVRRQRPLLLLTAARVRRRSVNDCALASDLHVAEQHTKACQMLCFAEVEQGQAQGEGQQPGPVRSGTSNVLLPAEQRRCSS